MKLCRKPCAPWSGVSFAKSSGAVFRASTISTSLLKTGANGVDIPSHLRERFPDEMTIVLQNKYWDLTVGEDSFSIGLSFNQIPANLHVPYAAITAFVDPSVDFGLQFQAEADVSEPEPHEDAENDTPETADASDGVDGEDGSNVVSVDFGRKK